MKNFFWLLLIFLVIFRFFSTRPTYHNGDRLRLTAGIFQEPIQYSTSQYLKLSGLKIYLPLYPEISYGDQVSVEGIVDGGKLKNPKLVSIKESRGILFKFRSKIIDFYRKVLPEPHASLVAGIVLGSKSSIPADFWQNLKTTGVAHVVVASGMNVAFVASFLISFLAIFTPRKRAVFIAVVAIWLYALISGFEAPIVRAAIMASIAFSAQGAGKLSFSWSILSLTALMMLIVNPSWISDTGFILTFVATGSLMLFQRRIDKLFGFIPNSLGFLREGFSTSLAAQIGVAPILFATFGQFNLLSPLINALVLWTVPLIMIIGAVGGIVGLIVPVIGRLILLISYPLTWCFINIVSIF